MTKKETITVEVGTIAALLPEHRVLTKKDLWELYKILSNLWEYESKGLPEPFRQKLFAVEQHVYNYLVNEPGQFRRTMAENLVHLETLIPDHPT